MGYRMPGSCVNPRENDCIGTEATLNLWYDINFPIIICVCVCEVSLNLLMPIIRTQTIQQCPSILTIISVTLLLL